MTRIAISTLVLAAAGVLAPTAFAKAPPAPATFTGHQLAGAARVSLAQARTIALKARPGDITDQELEKESGGSGLRYSFDIKSSGVTYEVGVDAKTGAVLEDAREGANPD